MWRAGETKKRERDRRPKKAVMKNEQSGTDHKPNNRQVVEIGGTGEPPTPSLKVMIPWKTYGVGANMVRDRPAKGPWTRGSQEGVAEEERQEEPVRIQTSESICLVGGALWMGRGNVPTFPAFRGP